MNRLLFCIAIASLGIAQKADAQFYAVPHTTTHNDSVPHTTTHTDYYRHGNHIDAVPHTTGHIHYGN